MDETGFYTAPEPQAPAAGNSLYYRNKRGGGGLNAAFLKIFAISVMFIDHFAVVFLEPQINASSTVYSVYLLLRLIGRLGFPIFAFLISEGARRTRSMPKYMLRLLIFGVISEAPFDVALISGGKNWIDFSSQNVYWTLLLGLVSVWAIRKLRGRLVLLSPVVCVACMALAWFVNTDYAGMGVLCIALFYVSGDRKRVWKIIGSFAAIFVLSLYYAEASVLIDALKSGTDIISIVVFALTPRLNELELGALLSLPMILLYNGERGMKFNKYFFYGFYPAHITLLYLAALLSGVYR